jgi:putative SOS response-associated peptidase YedK
VENFVCNLYSITTNQAAIIALFRVMNQHVGNLPPMPGVFPDYPAPVVRNAAGEREIVMMRWGMPPPPRTAGPPVTNIRNTSSPRPCFSSQRRPIASCLRSFRWGPTGSLRARRSASVACFLIGETTVSDGCFI